jgi:hypothetical protein
MAGRGLRTSWSNLGMDLLSIRDDGPQALAPIGAEAA